MKFSELKNLLTEKYLDTFKTSLGVAYEFYKNPSLSEIDKESRGIIDEMGNLYTMKVINNENSSPSGFYLVHNDILKRMRMLNLVKDPLKMLYVHRVSSSNVFKLSSTYPDRDVKIMNQLNKYEDLIKKFKKNNPDKNIELQKIWN